VAETNRIPFSVYDFFGYLASGFILLAAVDLAFFGDLVLGHDTGITLSLFWVIVAYVAGHVVANVSSYLLEKRLLRGGLGSPEQVLFEDREAKGWRRPFRGFLEPLPQVTRERVLAKAKEVAGIEGPGRDLFFHCLPIVRRDQVTLDRLNTFLNLYGFSRNVCMSLVIVSGILVVAALLGKGATTGASDLWLAAGALLAAVGLLYRYLKFFRLYTVEVFVNYAEAS
jgi:hypothetical protein